MHPNPGKIILWNRTYALLFIAMLFFTFILCPRISHAQTDEKIGWGSPIVVKDITLDLDRENVETIVLHMNRYYWPSIHHALETEKPVLIAELIPAQAPPANLKNIPLNGKWVQHLQCEYTAEKKTLKIIIDFKPFEHYSVTQFFDRENSRFLLAVTTDDLFIPQETSVKRQQIPSPASTEYAASQIVTIVESWRNAWEEKRLNDYFSFYHSEFQSKGKNMAAWKLDRKRVINKHRKIVITISGIQVTINGDTAKAFFKQQYAGDTYQDTGYKILELKKSAETWKIYREEWFIEKPDQWP